MLGWKSHGAIVADFVIFDALGTSPKAHDKSIKSGSDQMPDLKHPQLIARRTFVSAALTAPAWAHAQSWPAKPITIVVPFPAGGGTDLVIRALQVSLQGDLGVPVIIDNRAGAGGTVGTATAAKAPPDGYTLVVTTTSTVAAAAAVYPKLGYDPAKDIKPIAFLGVSPYVLAVSPSVKVNTVRELIAYAKAKPGSLNYASVGAGTLSHLIAELFKKRVGIDMVHVPYRGAAPAQTDLIGGVVQVLFDNPAALVQQVRAGRIKALAITQKAALMAEVPTFAETGVEKFAPELWYGLSAPANTPDAVISKIYGAVAKAQEDRAVRANLLSKGIMPISLPTSLIGSRIAFDTKLWGDIARSVGAKAE